LEGKTLVDVAIELDSPRQEVIGIFNDFLTLKNMHKASKILKDYKDQMAPFVKLFDWLNKNNTREKDIKYAIDSINNIKALEQRKSKLKVWGSVKKRGEGLSAGQPGRHQKSMFLINLPPKPEKYFLYGYNSYKVYFTILTWIGKRKLTSNTWLTDAIIMTRTTRKLSDLLSPC
jgi:hypothetical protein